MTPKNPSIVLAGGGTAGHISPLLAIAAAVRTAAPEAAILAVGTPAGMETRLVPAAGVELATIDRVPFPRKPSADLRVERHHPHRTLVTVEGAGGLPRL